jgi:hypothetical protein
MNAEQFKTKGEKLIRWELKDQDGFTAKFDKLFNEEDERISGSVEIQFVYGNCINKHIIHIGWDKEEGFGIEDHEGDLCDITHSRILKSMYFDLALKDLDDRYLF